MLRYGLLLLVALLASPSVRGVEALSSDELLSHCNHYHEPEAEADRIFCVRYIQGFIDGAVATSVKTQSKRRRVTATASSSPCWRGRRSNGRTTPRAVSARWPSACRQTLPGSCGNSRA